MPQMSDIDPRQQKPQQNEVIEETTIQQPQQNNDHWIEDPEEVFEEIVKLLEGYEWDDEEKTYKKHTSQQMMNKKGKQPSKVFLTGSGNKITYITDMNKNEVTQYLKNNHFALAEHLIDHYKEYDIDFNDLKLVFNALMNVIWSGAKRAEDGTLMRFKKNTETKQHKITRNESNNDKNKILPW